MSNVVLLRVSAGFVVLCLLLVSVSLHLSDRYLDESRERMVAGEMEEAGEYARTAERLDPVSSRPLESRAMLLQLQRQAAEAEEVLMRAVTREPNDYELYLALGDLQRQSLDSPETAAESYRQALELNPRSSRSATGLAQSLRNAGDLESARDAYERLGEIDDLSVRDEYDLGRIQVRTGDPEEGLQTLQRAKRQAEDEMEREGDQALTNEGFVEQVDHAITEALVVGGDYPRATRRLEASEAAQAPAALQSMYHDPDGYRESILSDDLSYG